MLLTRRHLLRVAGTGFGMVGAANLFAASAGSSSLAPKPPHFPPKATRIIHLFLNGGFSQVDSFDRKPVLDKFDGKPYQGKIETDRKEGNLMRSAFQFQRYGQTGIEVSECFPNMAAMIDDFCIVRSMYTDLPIQTAGLGGRIRTHWGPPTPVVQESSCRRSLNDALKPTGSTSSSG